LAAAAPVAQFYDAPILMAVLPVAGLYFVTGALGSVALPLLQKRMQFKRLNSFELLQQVISSSAHIFLAYLSPTVWALVLGGLVATAARSLSTYFILPGVRPRLHISKDYAWQIFSFGKWIFISSIIYFLSMNFDRLFFAKVSALEVLGVYGIARALCDMIGTLSIRLNNFIVFPLVAASQTTARNVLRAALINKRLAVLLVGAIGIALLTAVADWVTNTLYDNRYEAAGWMLAVLSVGAWFSIISSLNEATLLGLGKPSYSVFANGLKFAWLVIGLPISFAGFGFPGAVIVIATSEIFRYFPFALGQMRERFSFFLQDVFITLIMISLIGIIMWMRWRFGLGTSFDGMLVLSGPG
jgi:O-antigen/teichoic acid export membrane protein